MATRDTGGQQRATRTREETDEVEASVDTEVAERHKEMTETSTPFSTKSTRYWKRTPRNSLGVMYKKGANEHFGTIPEFTMDHSEVLPGLWRADARSGVHPRQASRVTAGVLLQDHARRRLREPGRSGIDRRSTARPRDRRARWPQVVSGLRRSSR